MNKSAIKGFVKGTLGCTCPDKVFRDIRFQANTTLVRCQSPVSRIELGDRLLIYLLVTDSPAIVDRDLPLIIRDGKQERDERGLNRFRVVVCTGNVGAVLHLANEVFARQTEKDERIHLHVVSRADVKTIFEPTAED
jgi:hypothetical protein